MLLNTGTNSKDIHIKNYVIRFESNLLGKKIERPLANLNLSLKVHCLSLLVKSHYNNGSTKLLYCLCLLQELLLTLLKAYRVYNSFTGTVVQSGKDGLPVR